MCRLYGWVEKDAKLLETEKLRLTRCLAWKSQAQGSDSYGFLARNDANKLYILRGLGTFKGSKQSKATLNKLSTCNMLMGHNRWASHGAVTIPNCHPFECENLIMSHNGVIANHEEYVRDTLLFPQGETDSETLLTWIVSHKKGIEGFIEIDSDNEAFTIYDKGINKLYLITKGRSLFVATTDRAILYSSEEVIATTACRTVLGIIPEITEIPSNRIVELSEYGLKTVKESAPTFTQQYNYPVSYGKTYEQTTAQEREAWKWDSEEAFNKDCGVR